MSQSKISKFDTSIDINTSAIDRLEEIRRDNGLEKQDFSAIIGVKQNTYSGWISKKHQPTVSAIIAASYRFLINEEWIIHGLGKKQRTTQSFTSHSDVRLIELIEIWNDGGICEDQKNSLLSVARGFRKLFPVSLEQNGQKAANLTGKN